MSQENVALVGELIAAVERQDLSRLIELTDPDVEWHSFMAELGEGGVYHGHDGMRRYVSDLSDAWEFLSTDVDDTPAPSAPWCWSSASSTIAAKAAGRNSVASGRP